MFRTIVVGTDWSNTAEIALVRALELTRAGDAQLHVVTAHDPTLAPVVGGPARPHPVRTTRPTWCSTGSSSDSAPPTSP